MPRDQPKPANQVRAKNLQQLLVFTVAPKRAFLAHFAVFQNMAVFDPLSAYWTFNLPTTEKNLHNVYKKRIAHE